MSLLYLVIILSHSNNKSNGIFIFYFKFFFFMLVVYNFHSQRVRCHACYIFILLTVFFTIHWTSFYYLSYVTLFLY